MIILLVFAFVSGLVTILAPCIWPLLPIILSSATTGGKNRPLGITVGICLSFAIFTLSISYLVKFFHLDPDLLRILAVIIIGFLGLILIFPTLSARLEKIVSQFSGKFSPGSTNKNGFFGGLLTGLALGIVWSPCAGPILATIATLATTTAVNFQVVLITFAYVSGVGIPLFVLSKASNAIFAKTRGINKYTGRIQQIFGVVMILTAISILTNFDKTLQVKLLDIFPQYSNYLTEFESNPQVKKQLDSLKGRDSKSSSILGKPVSVSDNETLPDYGTAPEFTGVTKWLNTEQNISLKNLKGKVVLIDFWTYTCINCIRTFPYLATWYEKYHDSGFTIIGVHTPEFEFEKKTSNVEMAIKKYGIKYPVAQDNDYSTWNAYSNNSWPAQYLIDGSGHVRKMDIGEGGYREMEMAIKRLLAEQGGSTGNGVAAEKIVDQTPREQISPETYFGTRRMKFFYPSGNLPVGQETFTTALTVPLNSFSLSGEWNIKDEQSTAGVGSKLIYHFRAKNVYATLIPGQTSGKIKVFIDGKQVLKGEDYKDGTIFVDQERLYTLVGLPEIQEHILEVEINDFSIDFFTITFG